MSRAIVSCVAAVVLDNCGPTPQPISATPAGAIECQALATRNSHPIHSVATTARTTTILAYSRHTFGYEPLTKQLLAACRYPGTSFQASALAEATPCVPGLQYRQQLAAADAARVPMWPVESYHVCR